jgi:hypothetical protein
VREMMAALSRKGLLPPCGTEVLNAVHPRDCGPRTAEATRKLLTDTLAGIV